jgi:hypothetical protein
MNGGRVPSANRIDDLLDRRIPMPKKSSRKRHEPSGHEEGAQILEAATKAGTDYAYEQVGGDHFRDWVYDQMLEAEAMRKRDPSSVIPLETPADAKKVARNMLQQLEWDTKRQLDQREILEMAGAKGGFDAGEERKYGITNKDVTDAFFEAFDETLKSTSVREWLTDLVLQTKEDMGDKAGVSEARRRPILRPSPRDRSMTSTRFPLRRR